MPIVSRLFFVLISLALNAYASPFHTLVTEINQRVAAKLGTIAAPSRVMLSGVTGRDGLQIFTRVHFAAADRLSIMKAEDALGHLERVEVGSLVSAKAIPVMANSKEVWENLCSDPILSQRDYKLTMLVGNEKGAEELIHLYEKSPPFIQKRTEIAFFTAACPTFLKANCGDDSLVKALAKASRVRRITREIPFARAYISMAFGSPYGTVAMEDTVAMSRLLQDAGYQTIAPSDTNGLATVDHVIEMVPMLTKTGISPDDISFHFHDLGKGVWNVMAAYYAGVYRFDGTLAGIGGCPSHLVRRAICALAA